MCSDTVSCAASRAKRRRYAANSARAVRSRCRGSANARSSRALVPWDETCPFSTEGGTRRVQLVREGGGGGPCEVAVRLPPAGEQVRSCARGARPPPGAAGGAAASAAAVKFSKQMWHGPSPSTRTSASCGRAGGRQRARLGNASAPVGGKLLVKRALFAPVGEKLLVKRHEAVTKLSRSSLRDGGQGCRGSGGARRVASGAGGRALQAGVVDARDERGGEQRRVETSWHTAQQPSFVRHILAHCTNNQVSFVTPRGASSLRAPPETALAPRGGAAALSRCSRGAPTPATRSGTQGAPRGAAPPPPPPPAPPPRTKWTRRVPHPVLTGHAASLTSY